MLFVKRFITTVGLFCILLIGQQFVFAQECDDQQTAQFYITTGESALNEGKPAEAFDLFSCAIELDPENVVAFIDRGVSHYFRGQFEDALVDYTTAIELDDQAINGWNNRGWVYNRLRQPELAIADFEQALALNPQFPDSLYGIADAYYQVGDLENALTNWNMYLTLAEDDSARQNVENIEAQLAVTDDACDMSVSTEDYTLEMFNTFASERYIDALQPAHCAILTGPDNAVAYSNRGNLLYHLGNLSDALSDLNMALSLDPTNLNALRARANIYQDNLDYESAIHDFNKVVILSTSFAGDGESLNTLAYAYMQIGDYENAFLMYERIAISYGKDDLSDTVLNNIAFVEQSLGRQVAESLTCMDETHEGDVRLWGTNYHYEVRIKQREDPQGALEYSNCAVLWMPYNYEFLNTRAEIQIALESYDEAFADIERALFYNPEYSLAYGSLGLYYYVQDHFDEALQALDEAIILDPENDKALVTRADLYYDLEMYDEALADYIAAQEATFEFVGRLPEYVEERVDELSE